MPGRCQWPSSWSFLCLDQWRSQWGDRCCSCSHGTCRLCRSSWNPPRSSHFPGVKICKSSHDIANTGNCNEGGGLPLKLASHPLIGACLSRVGDRFLRSGAHSCRRGTQISPDGHLCWLRPWRVFLCSCYKKWADLFEDTGFSWFWWGLQEGSQLLL